MDRELLGDALEASKFACVVRLYFSVNSWGRLRLEVERRL